LYAQWEGPVRAAGTVTRVTVRAGAVELVSVRAHGGRRAKVYTTFPCSAVATSQRGRDAFTVRARAPGKCGVRFADGISQTTLTEVVVLPVHSDTEAPPATRAPTPAVPRRF
jgi:hypothetical protein